MEAMYDSKTIQGVLAIQRRAVAYGAGNDVPIVDANGVLTWPADEERVAFDSLSYDQEDDTFAAWSIGGNGPIWEQR